MQVSRNYLPNARSGNLGLWPAAFVELILGKYVAMAIIILIAVALSQTIKFITMEEGKQDVQ